MKNSDQKLSDIFDIAPAINVTPALVPIVDGGVESDFDFARKNIRDLVEKGNLAVDNILQVASATDHPRAYEVASNMIKQLGELNRDLLSLQKMRKELSPQTSQTTVNVDKAVFVGSTAELIKQIKGIQ
jgi:hypothetical protein